MSVEVVLELLVLAGSIGAAISALLHLFALLGLDLPVVEQLLLPVGVLLIWGSVVYIAAKRNALVAMRRPNWRSCLSSRPLWLRVGFRLLFVYAIARAVFSPVTGLAQAEGIGLLLDSRTDTSFMVLFYAAAAMSAHCVSLFLKHRPCLPESRGC